MESRIYNVNLQSGYNSLTYIGISQYDAGVPLQFNVYDGATAASFPAGTTATIMGVRPSGVGFAIACTLTDNIVTVDSSTDMTGEAGKFPVEIRFEYSGVNVGTVNFMFNVEKAPHPDGTIDADITRQQTFVERLEAVEDDKVPYPVTNKYGTAGQVLSTLGDGTTEWTNGASGQELSDDAKQALLQIAQKVVYIDEHGQDYYDALYDAFYPPAPPATLVSISAVYTQSGAVYDTASLDDLKPDLVVTAHYDDSTSAVVTTYTLSGTLTVGTSTITVTYSDKTTTFDVVVSNVPIAYLYNWDFTQSLVDSVGGVIATKGASANQDSTGLHITALTDSYVTLPGILTEKNRTIEIDITSYDRQGTAHGRLVTWNNWTLGFIYNNSGKWATYNAGWHYSEYTDSTLFNGKTLVLKCKTDDTVDIYCDSTLIMSSPMTTSGNDIQIGSSAGNSAYNLTVTGVRVKEGVD